MSIISTVTTGLVFTIDGQPYDGFIVTVHDDEEYGGNYAFTEAYTHQSAHDLIFFSGNAVSFSEDGYVNQ